MPRFELSSEAHRHAYLGTVRWLLLLAALTGATTVLLESGGQADHLMDVVMPPLVTAVFVLLFLWLSLAPQLADRITRVTVWCAVLMLAFAINAFVLDAATSAQVTLIDTLPPVGFALFALTLVMVVLLPPGEALVTAIVAWFLIGAPQLFYLLFHPAEMGSSRGMELLMALGPGMLIMLLIVRFHLRLCDTVSRLQSETVDLKHRSERDALTGLYNRHAAESFLCSLCDGDRRLTTAVVLFDIDHFKRINDSHGHPAGDEVLREVARRCRDEVRDGDQLIRWGGEEFLLLVRDAGEGGVEVIAEKLRQVIAATPMLDALVVTASFGATVWRVGEPTESVLKRADEALYRAKREGRNRVVVLFASGGAE